MIAALRLRIQLEAGHVDQGFVGVIGAVLCRRNIVDLDADHASILPARAVVQKEAHIFDGSGHAETAAVAVGKLDRDGRFQKVRLRVEADAGEFFVLCISGKLFDRFE